MRNLRTFSFALALMLTFATAGAQNTGEPGRDASSPNPLKNVYFGEEHIHTGNSPDAFVMGVRASWDDVYNYAMGNEIKLSTTGETIKKSTPYDFVGLTDHAEYFGVMPSLIDPNDPLSKSPLAETMKTDMNSAINQVLGSLLSGIPMKEYYTPELIKTQWDSYKETANKYNKPGEFTTLIAWEWTSIPNGRNMHRNVFFRDGGPDLPFTAFDSDMPQDLWTFQEIQRTAGHDNLAIPHNGNVSDGWMYSPNTFLGGPMDARHAARQQVNEPLTEIVQTKGASETHPYLSPNDEFAGFEQDNGLINVGMPGQLRNSYIRQGLGEGMALENKLGSNPFKMGFVGGADSHSGYSPNEEFNFHGSHGTLDDTPEMRSSPVVNASGGVAAVVGSAGTTAVWAEENTRASLFDGMKARETYGTSGPLIRLRFFGGWDFSSNLTSDPDFVKKAYASGVPMGQDLKEMPSSAKAPTFAMWALKDPESGNLDRIQIIKVFVNKWDRPDEKIYDVVWSGDRKKDPKTGKVPAVGNTVNIKKATYKNTIGNSQLTAVWTDPDFDASQKATYYLRVLEIPTPRWSTYDAVKLGVEPLEAVPATIQERAWSSPIWYTPAK